MDEIHLDQPAPGQAQSTIVQNCPLSSLVPIEQYWEAIASLTAETQLLLVAIIAFSQATSSSVEETLELLDPDCAYVSESFEKMLQAICAEPRVSQLILVQTIATSVGLSLLADKE